MGLFVSVKRYVGVSYYESEKRRWEGKPDRCYYIRYPDGRLFSMSKAPLIIERTIDEVCNQGVEDPRYIAVFHTFRHTFASWLAMSGQVTPFELMELMGHKSLALTERYVHLMPSAKERGVKAVFG